MHLRLKPGTSPGTGRPSTRQPPWTPSRSLAVLASCSSKAAPTRRAAPTAPARRRTTPTIFFVAYSTPQDRLRPEDHPGVQVHVEGQARPEPELRGVLRRLHDPGRERRERPARRRRGALARARRGHDQAGRPHHERLDRAARRRHGVVARSWSSTSAPATPSTSRTGTTSRSRGVAGADARPRRRAAARGGTSCRCGAPRSAVTSPASRRATRPAATTLMNGVTKNVIAYDSSARSSIQNFEVGNGDVAITYENEVKTAQAAGGPGPGGLPQGLGPDPEPRGRRGQERREGLRAADRRRRS